MSPPIETDCKAPLSIAGTERVIGGRFVEFAAYPPETPCDRVGAGIKECSNGLTTDWLGRLIARSGKQSDSKPEKEWIRKLPLATGSVALTATRVVLFGMHDQTRDLEAPYLVAYSHEGELRKTVNVADMLRLLSLESDDIKKANGLYRWGSGHESVENQRMRFFITPRRDVPGISGPRPTRWLEYIYDLDELRLEKDS